jgi:hypothetical protein
MEFQHTFAPMTKSRRNTRKTAKQEPKNEPAKEQTKRSSRKKNASAAKPEPPKEPVKDAKKEAVKEVVVKKEAVLTVPEEKPQVVLDQSVAILIDGNNIEMSLHSVSGKKGAMINFDKLVPALLMNRALSRLIYFREGKSISQKLAERLQKLFHGSVVPCYKSADIPLTIKAVQVASKVDTIIILSGDADYVELVRHLKHDGIRVEIAAFPETTADVLRSESDYFFPISVDYSFVLK